MIEIKANPYSTFCCPSCQSSGVKLKDIVFQGIHILAEVKCSDCDYEFFHDMPYSQALYTPIAFGKNDQRLYDSFSVKWFSESLLTSYKKPFQSKISIRKKQLTNNQSKEIILLNCIDYLYGHVLLKLFNSIHYIDNEADKKLIIIIPKNFEWLLPKGTDEVWIVDLPLHALQNWLCHFNKFVQSELDRYERVFLSLAFSHPLLKKEEISRFTGVKPFDINLFSSKPLKITFISRNDRFWFSKKWLARGYTMLQNTIIGKWLRPYFSFFQNRRIIRCCRSIRKRFPNISLAITGVERARDVPSWINDYRTVNINPGVEKKWCQLYSESQIVIGVHGSNMLLPTAHAASFIEILPLERYGNIGQDVIPDKDPRLVMFLNRFVDECISPKGLARLAISIIRTFDIFHLNMNPQFLQHKYYSDVSDWAEKRRQF